MRDNRGVNRMVEVLNSGIETGNSSNLIPKSSLPVDAASSVLKERNTNDAIGDSTKTHAHDAIAKESKTNDARECKLNAHCASDSNSKQSSSQRTSNNLMMSLDVDEIDYDVDDDEDDDDEDEDDDEKCAKTSECENDSQNAMMDVDEPSESLYVTSDANKKYDDQAKTIDGSDKKITTAIIDDDDDVDDVDDDDDDDDEPVTIDSGEEEEKSIKKHKAEHESTVVVNGINKSSITSANDAVDKENAKSSDNTVKATTSKAVKRKASISSDGDQAPPAKA